ncbi:Hypothetical protein DPCES_1431 [Desulfitobacterium hafniense]|uniref:Uncharacterized protein n=1 Tax=Desulfitobacterium hafniense TaxID=49338 RepID=A0A098AXI0_DESHA|nr:hypothetical protein [Desulfitobacterium hafniense]CDX01318.1 Hypothetical protein DPCES_1431 [Desulfitobacterium hafniense]
MKKFKIPTGWRMQTGLNPGYFISAKRWAKERGRQVAEARKTGNVDAAIKALEEGKSYKNAIKETLKGLGTEHPYFVYDAEGKCRYILEREATKKWLAYTAE